MCWFSRAANTFFQLNQVFIPDSGTDFSSGLLWNHNLNFRSSHWSCSVKKGVLKNFVIFTEKHLCWGLKNRLQHRWRNSQASSILCSYRNRVETPLSSCGHICTNLGIPIAAEVEEKEQLKNMLKRVNLPFM